MQQQTYHSASSIKGQAHVFSSPSGNEWPQPQPIKSELLEVRELNLDTPHISKVIIDYVRDVSHRMQCPPDFVFAPLMVIASSIIGTGCGIRPKQKDDWLVVPNLWGGIVGRPGILKSPALEDPLQMLRRMETKADAQFEEELKAFTFAKRVYEAQQEAITKRIQAATKPATKPRKGPQDGVLETIEQIKADEAALTEPMEPACRRFRTNDSTVEKFAELLSQNHRGLLVYRDELSGFLQAMDREDRASDRQFWMETWNGKQSFNQDRIGRGHISVPHLCSSILGGIQPGKLQRYLYQAARSIENDGLIQRFQFMIYPNDIDWKLTDESPNAKVRDKLFNALDFLACTELSNHGAASDKIPYLHFDTEAQKVFFNWLSNLETDKIRNNTEDDGILIEHLSKYRSLMPSIALILHLIDWATMKPMQSLPPVTEKATLAAKDLCEYLESHARRIYGLVRSVHELAAAKLSAKIKGGKLQDKFTVRDVYRPQWQYLTDIDVVSDACDYLVDKGWIRPIPTTDNRAGRKPSQAFEINPEFKKC